MHLNYKYSANLFAFILLNIVSYLLFLLSSADAALQSQLSLSADMANRCIAVYLVPYSFGGEKGWVDENGPYTMTASKTVILRGDDAKLFAVSLAASKLLDEKIPKAGEDYSLILFFGSGLEYHECIMYHVRKINNIFIIKNENIRTGCSSNPEFILDDKWSQFLIHRLNQTKIGFGSVP